MPFQAQGGFIGADTKTFFSAVTSAAPGVFHLLLTMDAVITTALTIHPGQVVSIKGDEMLPRAPLWATPADDSCQSSDDGYCEDGGPNSVTGFPVVCALGTDATDCGTIPSDAAVVVQARSSLSLSYIQLGSANVALASGGSLSFASMAVPAAILTAAMNALAGAGSTLQLADVNVPEYRSDDSCPDANDGECADGGPNQNPNSGCHGCAHAFCTLGTDATDCETPPAQTLTGTVIVDESGTKTQVEGSVSFGSPRFIVSSGRTCTNYELASGANGFVERCLDYDDTPPCTVSDGGRCVGRPHGYGQDEECNIVVGGTGMGLLGGCGVFDLSTAFPPDMITLPSDTGCEGLSEHSYASERLSRCGHSGSNCPTGEALVAGDSILWTSGHGCQGGGGCSVSNGCASAGLCAEQPFSEEGLGGGWQICFAEISMCQDGSHREWIDGTWACVSHGCTNPSAINYAPGAVVDDGSCIGATCVDDPDGMLADIGAAHGMVFDCPFAFSREGDCSSDLSIHLPGDVQPGTLLSEICPVTCGACGEGR